MVEGTALEMRHLGNWIESSNLSLSARLATLNLRYGKGFYALAQDFWAVEVGKLDIHKNIKDWRPDRRQFLILHGEAFKAELHEGTLLVHTAGLKHLVGMIREVEYLIKLLYEFVRLALKDCQAILIHLFLL